MFWDFELGLLLQLGENIAFNIIYHKSKFGTLFVYFEFFIKGIWIPHLSPINGVSSRKNISTDQNIENLIEGRLISLHFTF